MHQSSQHLAVAVDDGEGEGFDVFLNLAEGSEDAGVQKPGLMMQRAGYG